MRTGVPVGMCPIDHGYGTSGVDEVQLARLNSILGFCGAAASSLSGVVQV